MTERKGSTKYAPILNGLWDNKHVLKMGKSVFLFGELLDRTDKTGKVEVTYSVLHEKTKIPIKNLERWMRRLKAEGYITISGKNPMTIQIQNFRVIQKGRIPQNVGGASQESTPPEMGEPVPSKMGGQKTALPPKVRETRTKMGGPNPVMPLKTDSSKPLLKDKIKREKPSQISDTEPPQNKPQPKKKTNPDVHTAVTHYHNEFFRIHGIKPQLTGSVPATFKKLLEESHIPLHELKELITGFLFLRD
ncbi:MAG: hypothetical protein ACE5EK_05505, partial [Nitrospinales bacterium]